MFIPIKLFVFLAGFVVIIFGAQEIMLRSNSENIPQELSCAELMANGTGQNAYVEVNDFFLCDFAVIYKEGSRGWKDVWVPAIPLGCEYHQDLVAAVQQEGSLPDDYPLPNNVRLIVRSSQVSDEHELTELTRQDTLEGVVVEGLGTDEEIAYEKSYPSSYFKKCLVLEVGRQPASILKIAGYFIAGVVLICLAFYLDLEERRRRKRSETFDEES